MSYENRKEDLDKVLSLNIGESYGFNMFQEGGACFDRLDEGWWELYEIPLHGGAPIFHTSCCKSELMSLIDRVYDEWGVSN